MRFSRVGRKVSSWVAILAVLMGALAPAISHALQSGAADSWIEVCTRLGAKWVSADTADESAPAPKSSQPLSLEHCPYCSLHVTAAALPPSSAVVHLLPLRFEVPQRFLVAPRTLHAWQPAQARAPPHSADA